MKHRYIETEQHVKCLVVGIHAPYNRTQHIDSYYQEFLNLIKTNGIPYEKALFIKLRSIDSAYFFTKGKLQELKTVCDELEVEHVVLSETLTAQQERNLSDVLDCTVFDRTALILEIFEKAAQSAEGKLQVKIAMLQHKRSRLAGKGIHLSQQAGMIGVRAGPGETLKERETRLVDQEIQKLKRRLGKIERSRTTQRKSRKKSGVPQICLIGYTNAGKSTILNVLTKSDVLAADKLFATLDTTTRELYSNGKKVGVISDTVGFIQNLPHTLIEAFKSTLSELQFADLLVHVVDISDVDWEKHIRVVHELLEELGVDKHIVYLFNKSDKITKEQLQNYSAMLQRFQPHVVVSSRTKEGLEPLRTFLATWQPAR